MHRKIAAARSKRQAHQTAPGVGVARAAAPIIENNNDVVIPDHLIRRIPTHDENAEITPEQLTEISSLLKMFERLHKQDIAVVSLLVTTGMSLITQRVYTKFFLLIGDVISMLDDTCHDGGQYRISGNSIVILALSTVAIAKQLYLDPEMLKSRLEGIREILPDLDHLEKLNVRDANNVIKRLKEINIENKKWTDTSSSKIRIAGFCMLFVLLAGYSLGIDPFYLFAYGAVFSAMLVPTLINDSRSIALNYNIKDKLINKKKIMEEIFHHISQVQCFLHQRDNIESSFYSFYLKDMMEDKISTKLACTVMASIFKKHGFHVEMSLKHLIIAINADVYITSALAAKMNQAFLVQKKVIEDIAKLKEQILVLAKKMNLTFTFMHQFEGLNHLFYAHASSDDMTKDMITQLEVLFAGQLSLNGAVITINGKYPLSSEKLDEFNASFSSSRGTSSSSDVMFINEKQSTKRIVRVLASESSDDELQSEQQVKQEPLAGKQSATIIKWPSGKVYDSSESLDQQDIHPFISNNLPNNKFFARSSLTKDDFSSSTIPYLYDRVKQQIDCPTTATKKGTQGFVLNLFGQAKDPQGNTFNYNGKIKLKGNQVGDVRAYFKYETDPITGAVLCDVKGWKVKAHKKRS